MNKLIFLLILVGWNYSISAQSNNSTSDEALIKISKKTYLFDQFIQDVVKSNPNLSQFSSQLNQAKAKVQSAAGAFDPKIYSEFGKKSFDSKTYYQKWETGIEYKTPSPFTFNAGFQENDGVYLNPENYTGKNRLWKVGVQLDLGQGLFTDEVRTRFQVSTYEQQFVQSDVSLQLNSFYLESSMVYWKWVESHAIWELYANMHNLALERKAGLVKGFANGDRSASDTLEAHTVVRQRFIQKQEAFLKWNEANLKLKAFIGDTQLEIVPPRLSSISISSLIPDSVEINSFIQSHPLLNQYQSKIDANKSELSLKWEQVRPELKLYYNYLSNTDNLQFDIADQAMMGLKFSLPLFFRKGRAGIQEYQAKVKEAEAGYDWAKLKLKASLEQEMLSVVTQLDLFKESKEFASELLQLLEFEKKLFQIGESSLFLVNQREYQYALAEIRKIKAFSEYNIQIERWKAINGTAHKIWIQQL